MAVDHEGIRAQMASGSWFEAADPSLAEDRRRADELMLRFNTEPGLSPEERMDIIRSLFGSVGVGSALSVGAQVDYGYNIHIGKNCFFNYNCVFLDGAPIVFGDDVWVGPNTTFATPLHPLLADERRMRFDADGTQHLHERNEGIVVEDGMWIASNVAVSPGVTIGAGAVIGTGSVVVKDIPAGVLAMGVPCKVVRELTEQDSIAGSLDYNA